MRYIIRIFFLIIICTLIVFSLPNQVIGDVGPKTSVTVDVFYNQQKITDPNLIAVILKCVPQNFVQKESNYEEYNLIPQLRINEYDVSKNCYWFPYRLASGLCSNGSCLFGYMIPTEFKLAIIVPSLNKVFTTHQISNTNF